MGWVLSCDVFVLLGGDYFFLYFLLLGSDFWVSSRTRVWLCLGPSEASGLGRWTFLPILGPLRPCCTVPSVVSRGVPFGVSTIFTK